MTLSEDVQVRAQDNCIAGNTLLLQRRGWTLRAVIRSSVVVAITVQLLTILLGWGSAQQWAFVWYGLGVSLGSFVLFLIAHVFEQSHEYNAAGVIVLVAATVCVMTLLYFPATPEHVHSSVHQIVSLLILGLVCALVLGDGVVIILCVEAPSLIVSVATLGALILMLVALWTSYDTAVVHTVIYYLTETGVPLSTLVLVAGSASLLCALVQVFVSSHILRLCWRLQGQEEQLQNVIEGLQAELQLYRAGNVELLRVLRAVGQQDKRQSRTHDIGQTHPSFEVAQGLDILLSRLVSQIRRLERTPRILEHARSGWVLFLRHLRRLEYLREEMLGLVETSDDIDLVEMNALPCLVETQYVVANRAISYLAEWLRDQARKRQEERLAIITATGRCLNGEAHVRLHSRQFGLEQRDLAQAINALLREVEALRQQQPPTAIMISDTRTGVHAQEDSVPLASEAQETE